MCFFLTGKKKCVLSLLLYNCVSLNVSLVYNCIIVFPQKDFPHKKFKSLYTSKVRHSRFTQQNILFLIFLYIQSNIYVKYWKERKTITDEEHLVYTAQNKKELKFMLSENSMPVKWTDCFGYAHAAKQCLSLCMFCHVVHTGVGQSFNSLEKFSNLSGFFRSGKRRETLIVLIWSGKKWQRKSAIWGYQNV